MLARENSNIGVFRPIINAPREGGRDPFINLMLQHFKIDMKYEDAYAYTRGEAREIINNGSRVDLVENIIGKYEKCLARHDFLLCLGTDYMGNDPIFEFELNADIASSLGCPVIMAMRGDRRKFGDIKASLMLMKENIEPYGLDMAATIITRADLSREQLEELRKAAAKEGKPALIYAIPDDPAIFRATMNDVRECLNAEILSGASGLDAPVGEYLVAAMQAENFPRCIKKDQLVITAADRDDILKAAIDSRLSPDMPNISGIVLTCSGQLAGSAKKILASSPDSGLPALLSNSCAYEAITALRKFKGAIDPQDKARIDAILGLYEKHVDGGEIMKRIMEASEKGRMSPMMFEYELIERAKSDKMRIVLAEGEEERILRATDILLRREVADIILLGDREKISKKAKALGLDISMATLIAPASSPKFAEYAHAYCEYRSKKGVTEEQATQKMMDATYFGTMMVKQNDADGMVSGSINTTAHTIRPAFEFIKTKPGFSVVSSVFLMCLKDRVLVFGDCAVNPNPTAQQLAEIAIASAHTAKVFGITPRVAMLSYSTGSSGKGEDVDLVIKATKIAREMAPDLALEGPLQYDAAIDPIVARTKLPGSQVAGKATVFIFPDLNTGNNTYKAVQRAANAIAIGPVLQGLNKPVNDLSRGCLVPDIVNTVAITAVQAAADKKNEK